MDASELIKQCDRLRRQIPQESDLSLRREMKKTYKHYNREIRKATKHRSSWFGFKSNLLFATIVFFGILYLLLRMESTYGWLSVLLTVTLSAIIVILLSAPALLLIKAISESTYQKIVEDALHSLNKLRGGLGRGKKEIEKQFNSSNLHKPPYAPPTLGPTRNLEAPAIDTISAKEDLDSEGT